MVVLGCSWTLRGAGMTLMASLLGRTGNSAANFAACASARRTIRTGYCPARSRQLATPQPSSSTLIDSGADEVGGIREWVRKATPGRTRFRVFVVSVSQR
jgi:hypothetical protein